jgi:hypothetical protein
MRTQNLLQTTISQIVSKGTATIVASMGTRPRIAEARQIKTSTHNQVATATVLTKEVMNSTMQMLS